MTTFTPTETAPDLLRQAEALLACSAGPGASHRRFREVLAPDILGLADRAAALGADPERVRRVRAQLDTPDRHA